MLLDEERKLLTAYVDGEISSEQRNAVLRLLQRSAEARALLQHLQNDAQALKNLKPPPLDRDFSGRVLHTIRERGLRPSHPIKSHLPAIPIWTGVAAAATVLIAVGLVTFFFVVRSHSAIDPMAPSGHVLRDGPQDSHGRPKDEPKPPVVPPKKDDPKDLPPKKDGNKEGNPEVPPTRVVEKPEDPIGPELPPGSGSTDPVVAGPYRSPHDAVVADVVIPETFQVHAFHQSEEQKRLQDMLTSAGIYLELLSRNPNTAFARVEAACQSLGIRLHIDKLAQAHRKQKKWKPAYLFYMENLRPEDIVALVDQIRKEDVKAEKKKRRSSVLFEAEPNLIAGQLTREHRGLLATLIGKELQPVPPPSSSKKPGEIDIRKPLSEQTTEEVVAALSAPTNKEHQALALTYNTRIPRPKSQEVARFVEARKPTPPGTLPLILILRHR